MRKSSLLLVFLVFNWMLAFGQENVDRLKQHEVQNIIGTFQVVLSHRDLIEPELTQEFLEFILSERKSNEDVYIDIDAYTRVLIVSQKTIDAVDFEPIKTYRYE